jgi:hypothetical protein
MLYGKRNNGCHGKLWRADEDDIHVNAKVLDRPLLFQVGRGSKLYTLNDCVQVLCHSNPPFREQSVG